MNSAILVYGYEKNDADTIYKAISTCLNRPLSLYSASGNESSTIELLLTNSENHFEENDPKIIMFVSIEDEEIRSILNLFPSSVSRPIFCGLTTHNKSWTFTTLKEHLLEEKAYWDQQKEK
jgi:hypothetical protein